MIGCRMRDMAFSTQGRSWVAGSTKRHNVGTSACRAEVNRGRRLCRRLPIALLLALAFLGHDFVFIQSALGAHGIATSRVQRALPVSTTNYQPPPAAHDLALPRGAPLPSREHSLDCGETGNALFRLARNTYASGQLALSAAQAHSPASIANDFATQSTAADPPRRRLAMFQVLLI